MVKAIFSRENPRVKQLRALSHSARVRSERKQTLLDGAHLISAALESKWPLREVFFSEKGAASQEITALLARCEAAFVPMIQLPDALFRHISPVETPSGILALIDFPDDSDRSGFSNSLVVLDGIQDPGNMGTILRTTAAAGIQDILLVNDCVHPWSPRVVRAGMGAHFQIRICKTNNIMAVLDTFEGQVVTTSLSKNAECLYLSKLHGKLAWLFGSEGHGVSQALADRADLRVRIPLSEGIESLNVAIAAAICLFEQKRQATF